MKTLTLLLFAPITLWGQTLIGSYPFTGNADADGAGNNGVVNGAVLTSDRFGISNAAYLFDGIDDYIDLGQGYSYTSHSFSLWARRDSTVGVVLSKINNGPYDTQNSELGISGFILGTGSTWVNLYSTASGVDFSNWNHIVGTYNSLTGAQKIYINGFADNTSAPSYINVTNTPIYVGARPFWSGTGSTTFYFKGAIDDIHIYDYEISSAQVDSLYNYNPLTTGIAEIDNGPMVVYPNPGEGLFNISGSAEIFDMYGRFLFRSTGLIDLTGYSDGLYFYKSVNKTGKIIKTVVRK